MIVAGLEMAELKPGFGAEIHNVDLAKSTERTLDSVVEVFNLHGAVLLRDQNLSPDDLVRFMARFNEPEDHTIKQFTMAGHPKIYLLSNKVVDGKPIGAHNDGIGWHTDYSYKEAPVMCTMLYAVEVPPEGSDTLIADLCAAYDELPPERKRLFDSLMLHHSYQYFMETREFGRKKLTQELIDENPDVVHPLVRVHPRNGRRALWVSTGTVREVVGMPNPEGLKLLDDIVAFATQERFVYRHKWRVGDVLVWDNRCTLHTGTLFDDKKHTRLMYRLWAKGEKPMDTASARAQGVPAPV
ncbi:MAG: TauD/TfdA family dioxygenase [Proteobacteria bacterium]|nr:TauD/TfdA family dioxygenase [Pseudomonadota bacterium]